MRDEQHEEIRVKLLGRGEILNAGSPVRLRSGKVLELVAFLAVHPSGASRQEIADALWPDLPVERKRHNLRQTLVYCRQLHPALVIEERDNLRFRSDVSVDVRRFQSASRSSQLESLRAAVELYEGPLLAGNNAEWIDPFRDRQSSAYLEVLLRLADELRDQPTDESLRYAELAVAEDKLHEEARMALILALEKAGKHVKAVEALQQYRQLVRDELGIEVSAALFRAVGMEPPQEGSPEKARRPTLSPFQQLQQETARAPIYQQSGRLSEGRRRLLAAIEAVTFATDEKSRAYSALSRLDYEAGAYHAALAHAEKAETQSTSHRTSVLAKMARARACFAHGRLEEAGALIEAVKKKRIKEDLELASETYTLSALLSYFEHRPQDANRLAMKGFRLAQAAASPFLQVIALNASASALFKQDRLNESITAFRQALKVAENHYMPLRVGHLSASLGRLVEAQGDSGAARDYYLRALNIFKSGESSNYQAIVGTYMAELALREGDPESALDWHRRCLAIRRTTGDRIGLATSLRGMGKSLVALDRHKDAIEHLRRAIRAYQAADDEYGIATCLVPLARSYWRSGEPALAQQSLTQAEETLARYSDRVAESFEDPNLSTSAIESLRSQIQAS